MRGTTGYISNSDIPVLDRIVQNTGMEAGRNLLIDALRECFSRDRMYRWIPDPWGFNKTPAATGLALDAGVNDSSTTRLSIGASFRFGQSFLPSITVKQTRMAYKPVSFNQNKWELEYGERPIIDEEGRIIYVRLPVAYSYFGLWEASYEIKVKTKSLEDTTKLHDIITLMLQGVYREQLQQSGLFIKDVSSSGEQEENDGGSGKDPVHISTISINTLSEWQRRIPISSTVERLQVCVNYDILTTDIPARNGTTHLSLQPDGEFKIFYGAESFALVNESNISSLPFVFGDTPVGTYDVNALSGEYIYFAAPIGFNLQFSAGSISELGQIVISGIDYTIYRSATTGLGAVTFTVS